MTFRRGLRGLHETTSVNPCNPRFCFTLILLLISSLAVLLSSCQVEKHVIKHLYLTSILNFAEFNQSMAFKEACAKANPTLLEPIMKVVVTAPEEYMGDVMGDINARRGQIAGSDIRNGAAIIESNVPLSNMFGYATDLRSKTQGRATYSMEPSHFVELPKNLQESLINK